MFSILGFLAVRIGSHYCWTGHWQPEVIIHHSNVSPQYAFHAEIYIKYTYSVQRPRATSQTHQIRAAIPSFLGITPNHVQNLNNIAPSLVYQHSRCLNVLLEFPSSKYHGDFWIFRNFGRRLSPVVKEGRFKVWINSVNCMYVSGR